MTELATELSLHAGGGGSLWLTLAGSCWGLWAGEEGVGVEVAGRGGHV